mmetsp:Transcript_86505/g.242218  ORF Transcript_86505/g.242218 Transcript_86505/m.242218 type:complete len:285 (+) Transcript_86505:26-880(+)
MCSRRCVPTATTDARPHHTSNECMNPSERNSQRCWAPKAATAISGKQVSDAFGVASTRSCAAPRSAFASFAYKRSNSLSSQAPVWLTSPSRSCAQSDVWGTRRMPCATPRRQSATMDSGLWSWGLAESFAVRSDLATAATLSSVVPCANEAATNRPRPITVSVLSGAAGISLASEQLWTTMTPFTSPLATSPGNRDCTDSGKSSNLDSGSFSSSFFHNSLISNMSSTSSQRSFKKGRCLHSLQMKRQTISLFSTASKASLSLRKCMHARRSFENTASQSLANLG